MVDETTGRIIFLAFILAIIIGLIILQIFLSKKESKWPGLMLPIISFSVSLLTLSGILLFTVQTGVVTRIEDGVVVEQIVSEIVPKTSVVIQAVYFFLMFNIPTMILLAIYGACRGRQKKKRDLEKMSALDLG